MKDCANRDGRCAWLALVACFGRLVPLNGLGKLPSCLVGGDGRQHQHY